MRKLQIAAFTVILGAVMSVVAVAQPIGRPNPPVILKAVDNFTFVADISGSMMMKNSVGLSKITVAKLALAALNDRMPELDYTASLYTVCDITNPVMMGGWDRMAFGKAVSKLPVDLAIFGRQTDLGDDVAAIKTGLRGGVVFATDGVSNIGPDAVLAFTQAKRMSGAKFAILSLADTKKGMENVRMIANATQAYVVDAADLMIDPVAVDAFIKEMFYVEREAVVNTSVFFATGKAVLTADTMSMLDNVVVTILNNPRGVRTVSVEGFADAQGGFSVYNHELAEKRAKAVKEYLVEKGVAEMVIYYRGDSVSYKATNRTPAGRQDNRRVDLILN